MRTLFKRLTSLVSAYTLLLGLLVAIPLSFTFPSTANAAQCGAWPTLNSQWVPVYTTNGKELTDPAGDVSTAIDDIVGSTSSLGVQGYSAIEWYADGSCLFFRIQLAASPTGGSGRSSSEMAAGIWTVAVADNPAGPAKAFIGVNSKGNRNDWEVFVANASGTVQGTSLGFTGVGGSDQYVKLSSENSKNYLNFQVPVSRLSALLSSTVVGFFAGTSQANTVSSINLDWIGASSTPTFSNILFTDISTNLSTVSFPTITNISPNKGPIAGGTSVTISGTDLGTISQVSFGGKYATITSTSSTSVVVTAPAVTSPGPVDIYVVNYKGASATSANAFAYYTTPTVTAGEASGISTTAGTMNGTVSAGGDGTAVSFCYSTSSTLASCTSVTPSNSPITGNTPTPVSYELSGLAQNTTYYYRLIATNTAGTVNNPSSAPFKSFTTATTPLVISTTSLAGGTVGTSGYSQQLLASGGVPTYSWSLSSGSLPAGLTLVPSGVISGTPTTTGASTFTARVIDSVGTAVTRSLNIDVSAGAPTVFTFDPSAVSATAATFSGRIQVNGAATTENKFCLADSGDVDSNGKLVTCRVVINATPATTSVATGAANISAASGTLVSGAKYFYQAYAVNSVGTTYGDPVSFTAIPAATISVALPGSATTASFGTSVAITASTDKAGVVTFKADGSVISGCSDVSTSGSGSSFTATCTWTPTAVSSSVLITGTLDPTDTAFPTVTSSPPLSIAVSAAGASAPNISGITTGSKSLTVAFSAPTSNGGATITNYQYTTDGTNWIAFSPASINSPYTITKLSTDGTTDLSNGTSYPIQIRAVNSSGGGTSSNTVNATPVASPPTITSLSPTGGPVGGSTSVAITGTNFTGSTAVTFGGTNASSFTVNSATSITAVTPAKTAGSVDVVVTNPDGIGTSTGGFTYYAAPTVTNVTSSTTNGSYKAGGTITVTVTFSGSVTVTGTPQLTLETGSTDRVINYTSGSGTNTLSFTYTVQSGDTSADLDYSETSSLALNSGTIQDSYSQNAVLTLPSPGATGSLAANKAIVIDTSVPTITGPGSSTTSTSAASILENTTAVHSFTANETVTWSLSGADALKFTIIGGALAFAPAPNYEVPASAASTNVYTVVVTGADAAGNATTQTVTVTVTDADEVAPTVSNITSTTNNGSYKAGDSIAITITFSESVIVTGTPQITLETGSTDRTASYSSGSGTNTLTFTYTVQSGDSSSDLEYISTSALALNGGTIKDAANNNATLTLITPTSSGSLSYNKTLIIDAVAPSSTASATSATFTGTTLNISYTSTDGAGTGVSSLSVYVSINSDLRSPTLCGTTTTSLSSGSITCSGLTADQNYYFYSVATDAVGNVGAASSSTTALKDSNALTVSLSISGTSKLKATSTKTITITLSEAASGFEVGDITAPAGSLSSFSGSGTSYTVVFTMPSGVDSNVTITTAAGGFTKSGNSSTNAASNDLILVRDGTAPTITGPSGSAGAGTSSDTIPENSTSVHTMSANEDVTWSLSTADSAKFEITSGGVLSFSSAPDFETPLSTNTSNTYVVHVTATDAAGNISYQDVTVIVADVDEAAPTITGPSGSAGADNSSKSVAEGTTAVHSFTANETVTWTLSGADALKFTLLGGALAFAATPDYEAPGSGATPSSNVYTVIVTATDSNTNASTQTVTVTVTDVDESILSVVEIKSTTSNGSYNTGDSITITIKFNNVATVTGTPELTLETATTDRKATYTSGSGTDTLSFTYTVQSGDTASDLDYVATNSLELNGGTIKSSSESDAVLTLPSPGATNSLGANAAIVIDSTVPTVTITNGGSSEAATNDTRTITFTISESVTDFAVGDITVSGGSIGSLSGSGASYTLTFTMGSGSGNATITVGSGSFSDAAGNANSGSTTITITRTSPSSPTISSLSPSTGPVTGGTVVTITGTRLTGTTSVTFGGVAGTSLTVNSSTSVTVTTPAGSAGAVSVVITVGANSTTATFTYENVNSTSTLSASPTTAVAGSAVTLTANITPSGATGTYTFKNGGVTICTVTISAGVATCSWTPTTAGTFTLSATYSGNSTYSSSNSSNLSFTATSPPASSTESSGSSSRSTDRTESESTNGNAKVKVKPVVVWSTPSAIAASSALSKNELNAVATTAAGAATLSSTTGTTGGTSGTTGTTTGTTGGTTGTTGGTTGTTTGTTGGTTGTTGGSNSGSGSSTPTTPKAEAIPKISGKFVYIPVTTQSVTSKVTEVTTITSAQNALSGTTTKVDTVPNTNNTPSQNSNQRPVLEEGTTLAPGLQKMRVIFIPDDAETYEPVETEVEMWVQAETKVNWTPQSSILKNTPLSNAQLNAFVTAPGLNKEVEGTITYDIEPGTVLPPGKYQIKAKFTPTDPTFLPSETVVEITVDKAIKPVVPAINPAVKPDKPVLPVAVTENVVRTGKPEFVSADELETVVIQKNATSTGLDFEATNWRIGIASTTKLSMDASGTPESKVTVVSGNTVTTTGSGFKPLSQVDIFVFSTPTWVGSTYTDAEGKFSATFPVPATLPIGDHTFQANGLTPDGYQRTASVPISLVKATPTKASSSFNVFYGLNSATLDSRAINTIRSAFNSLKSKLTPKSVVSVAITGWVQPTTKSPNVNGLSNGRAKAVQAQLKKLGLKAKFVIKAPGHDKSNKPSSRRATAVISWTSPQN